MEHDPETNPEKTVAIVAKRNGPKAEMTDEQQPPGVSFEKCNTMEEFIRELGKLGTIETTNVSRIELDDILKQIAKVLLAKIGFEAITRGGSLDIRGTIKRICEKEYEIGESSEYTHDGARKLEEAYDKYKKLLTRLDKVYILERL